MHSNTPGELIGVTIWGSGALMWLFGYCWILIPTFRMSYVWGMLCLLFPPVCYLFGLFNWRELEKPMVILVVGLVVMLFGGAVAKREEGLISPWEYFVPLPITTKYLHGP